MKRVWCRVVFLEERFKMMIDRAWCINGARAMFVRAVWWVVQRYEGRVFFRFGEAGSGYGEMDISVGSQMFEERNMGLQ